MSGIDDPINDRLGLPGLAKIEGDAANDDAASGAIKAAARRVTGALDAARLLLALCGGAMKTAGVPLGATAVDLARAALDAATEKRA